MQQEVIPQNAKTGKISKLLVLYLHTDFKEIWIGLNFVISEATSRLST